MPERWKISLTVVAAFALAVAAMPAAAGVPDVTNSFYVPQGGTVATPTEGTTATRVFRMCPNNDGGASLPKRARGKGVGPEVNGNGNSGEAGGGLWRFVKTGRP